MKQTKVYLLDCGTMSMEQSSFFWGAGLKGARRFPVYGVLVEHAEGNFLFDTGFDIDHIRKTVPHTKPMQGAEQTIPGQLGLIGLSADRISHVINSHYHLDHCGGNKFCLHATTVCHKCELETLASPTPQQSVAYSDISFAPNLRHEAAVPASDGKAIDIFTPRFEALTGDQEIASGIFLFETAGHTAGHYSLMVKLQNRRPMLFAADACYSEKNMDMMCIQAGNADPAQALQSMQRLKDLAQKYDAELFYSHDPESWPCYQRAPAYYS
jgi:4-pyridoxolactonase